MRSISRHSWDYCAAIAALLGMAFLARAQASERPTQHQVIPILLRHCTPCHGATQKEGGVDLRTREAMLRPGRSGAPLVPGDAGKSLLLTRVQAELCPPKERLVEANVKPLSPGDLQTLTDWIVQGALEIPEEPSLAGTPSDPLVRPRDRQFWAFQSPRSIVPPQVKESARVRTPIDAFLLKALEDKGASFAAEATRTTLLRRVTFDLTGLPPTPEEAQGFLSDNAPDAYERLVDRLLASPRYGERWGRYWLDVAGYSDVEGRREQHLPRAFAYRYRDYVIRAFNADKPYDRFLQEQIAGDELADYEHAPEITQEIYDNLVATGFLRMTPDPTWANITGFVPDRLEIIADAMDVLGAGVMGLTLKCARCHDHKFDPIPQRDYYRMIDLLKGALDEYNWLKPDLRSYGGAANTGKLGERSLPYVLPEERRAWESKSSSTNKPMEPRIAALWDRGEPSPTYLYRRGDYQQPGPLVRAGIPSVLADTAPFEIKPPWPGAKQTGRRLALARWLTSPQHPLTSRVFVNRVWKHHFGQGLVRSLGNFGLSGTPPSHPELLDWLATELTRNQWHLKPLQRLIVTSTAYRQSSASAGTAGSSAVAGSPWLSGMPLRRLDAEALWDTAIFVAGCLDETRYGPPVPPNINAEGLSTAGKRAGRWRRSIYGEQLRKGIPTVLELFDQPQMNPNCTERTESIVATQALHLMNDSVMRELASRFAERVLSEAGDSKSLQIQRAYLIAYGRHPTEAEGQRATMFLRQFDETLALESASTTTQDRGAMSKALSALCHLLMNSAEFVYID